MNDIQENELRPGLVVHLSPETLGQQVGVRTNADCGREVQGPHFFLVLRALQANEWLLAPLYGEQRPKRLRLSDDLKAGEPLSWINQPGAHTNYEHWISEFQHWTAPSAAILASLHNDNSTPDSRRFYAEGHPGELERFAAPVQQNRNGFHPIGVP